MLGNTGRLDVPAERSDLYIASVGERAARVAPALAASLRKEGVSVEFDLMDRGVKAQMKYADKTGARFVAVIGDDEMNAGKVALKNMATGESVEVPFDGVAGVVK